MERWWSALGARENHDVPTFKKFAPRFIQNHTAPLRAPLRSHTLIVSNCCCHDGSISEPDIIKIMWLRARARYYCWWDSFGWTACYRPLPSTRKLCAFSKKKSNSFEPFCEKLLYPWGSQFRSPRVCVYSGLSPHQDI